MIRVGIVGCGKIADQHAFQIERIRNSKIVAACDRDLLMARQFADRNKIAVIYSDMDTMLSKGGIDVVHITTPPQSHFEIGTRSESI